MSPRFQSADIDEVRERADIVEIVSEHVRLKRSGRSWKGLCPFHQEKTPSFNVDREKGLWFCYGCGVGGSVFTFLEAIENLTFPEAVETLARRYGVELRHAPGSDKRESPRARLVTLHEEAVQIYRGALTGRYGEPVRQYLASRGIGSDAWERYRIGFGGWTTDGLIKTMLRKGFTAEDMISSGLATREGRAMRDTFRGRLLFPIFDASDRPIGFGGRVLPPEHRREGAPENPKYLNSRETAVFKKSRVLYGTNWARGDVVRAKRLVVVEGYTDVIAMHAAGVPEAVATCGTALTEQHMQEISRRFGDVRIVLCLDADAAGQAAMSRERTEELAGAYSPGEAVRGGWLPVGRGWLPEVAVATLPAGRDPADFARESGPEGVQATLGGAVPLVEFLLRRALQVESSNTPEGRSRAVRKGAEILGQLGDSLLRHEYSLWLADRVGVEPYEVSKVVEERAGRPRGATQHAPVAAQTPLTGHHRVEREAMRALVAMPDLLDDAIAIGEDDFTLPLHRAIYRLARAEWEEAGRVDPSRLADRVQEDSLRRVISELSVGQVPDAVAGHEMLVRLKEFALGREIEDCKARLRGLDPDREAEAYDALFETLLELEIQRRSLGERS
jgi:DNA primase